MVPGMSEAENLKELHERPPKHTAQATSHEQAPPPFSFSTTTTTSTSNASTTEYLRDNMSTGHRNRDSSMSTLTKSCKLFTWICEGSRSFQLLGILGTRFDTRN